MKKLRNDHMLIRFSHTLITPELQPQDTDSVIENKF